MGKNKWLIILVFLVVTVTGAIEGYYITSTTIGAKEKNTIDEKVGGE